MEDKAWISDPQTRDDPCELNTQQLNQFSHLTLEDSQVTNVTNRMTVILCCCCIWGQHLAWHSPTNSQSKIKNSWPCVGVSAQRAVPTDTDKTASAHNWIDRPIRGTCDVGSAKTSLELPKARPAGDTRLWLARVACWEWIRHQARTWSESWVRLCQAR